MRKLILLLMATMFLLAIISINGCKKAEEQKPAEPARTAPAPAPAGTSPSEHETGHHRVPDFPQSDK